MATTSLQHFARTMNASSWEEAIGAAIAGGARVHKYADPTEGEAYDLDLAAASAVADEDPTLIYFEGGAAPKRAAV